MKVTLMNREVELLDLELDETGNITTTSNLRHRHLLPYSLTSVPTEEMTDALESWLREKCIPTTRKNIDKLLMEIKIKDPLELSLKSNALSLSDQYWIRFRPSEKWEDLNFFDNSFYDDVGLFFSDNKVNPDFNFQTPGSTTNGVLPKGWLVKDGTRLILKGSVEEEPNPENFREIYASRMFKLILKPSEFVYYYSAGFENNPVTHCENFITRDTEFVPMNSILEKDSKSVEDIDYFYLKDLYGDNYHILDWMLIMDRILLNTDRHFGNFGFIRSAITGELLRPAPIFDNGDSLFPYLDISKPIEYPSILELWPLPGDWDKTYSGIDLPRYREGLVTLQSNYEKIFHMTFCNAKEYNDLAWQDCLLITIKSNIEYLLSKTKRKGRFL